MEIICSEFCVDIVVLFLLETVSLHLLFPIISKRFSPVGSLRRVLCRILDWGIISNWGWYSKNSHSSWQGLLRRGAFVVVRGLQCPQALAKFENWTKNSMEILNFRKNYQMCYIAFKTVNYYKNQTENWKVEERWSFGGEAWKISRFSKATDENVFK